MDLQSPIPDHFATPFDTFAEIDRTVKRLQIGADLDAEETQEAARLYLRHVTLLVPLSRDDIADVVGKSSTQLWRYHAGKAEITRGVIDSFIHLHLAHLDHDQPFRLYLEHWFDQPCIAAIIATFHDTGPDKP